MTRPELYDRLQKIGMGDCSQILADDTRPCLVMKFREITDPDGTDVISRIGGCPDLPEGAVWPLSTGIDPNQRISYGDEQYEPGPMRFIAQIRLEDVASLQPWMNLPAKGILYFFSAVQKYDFPHTGCLTDDWRIMYWDGNGRTAKTSPERPSPEFIRFFEIAVDHYDSCFKNPKTCAIDFSPYLQVDIGCRMLPQHLRIKYGSAMMDEFWSEQCDLFGGRPVALQSEIDGCGDYRPMPEWAKLKPKEREDAFSKDDAEWIQIAQFTSCLETGVHWPGFARAFFMIRKDDLTSGRFELAVQVTQI